jgi:hypothetical protein
LIDVALIKNKKSGNVWDIPIDSEAYRRCKAHLEDYEILASEVKAPAEETKKKPEKSG